MPKKRTKKGWVHINIKDLEALDETFHRALEYIPDPYEIVHVQTFEEPNTWFPAWHTGIGWYGRTLKAHATVKSWKKVYSDKTH